MAKKQIDQPMKAKGVVHKMIADTAKGIAREQWATLARHNAFYKAWPEPEPFVAYHWPKYIDTARFILVGMLGSPKYDQHTKDQIFDAVLRDGAVNPKTMAKPALPVFTFGKS